MKLLMLLLLLGIAQAQELYQVKQVSAHPIPLRAAPTTTTTNTTCTGRDTGTQIDMDCTSESQSGPDGFYMAGQSLRLLLSGRPHEVYAKLESDKKSLVIHCRGGRGCKSPAVGDRFQIEIEHGKAALISKNKKGKETKATYDLIGIEDKSSKTVQ